MKNISDKGLYAKYTRKLFLFIEKTTVKQTKDQNGHHK